MEEITKKAIRFTDIEEDIEREELLEDLCGARISYYTDNTDKELHRKLMYDIDFHLGEYGVSKEDYDWCVDYLKAKADKND